jgi:hypothetical protein
MIGDEQNSSLILKTNGSVKLRFDIAVILIYKQIKPLFNMFECTILFSARKMVIKTFSSVFDILHGSLDYAFFKRGMNMVIKFVEPTSLWIPATSIC